MKDGLPDKIPGAGPLRVDMALESLPSTAGNEDRLRLLPPRLGKKKCGDPILSFGVGHLNANRNLPGNMASVHAVCPPSGH